jgi:hypothetical protein
MQPMPEQPVPPQPAPMAGKAQRREDIMGKELTGFVPTMRQFLSDQLDRILADIERELGPKTKGERKAQPETWWDQERDDRLLRETLRGLYVRLSRSALTVVAEEMGRIVFPKRVSAVTEKLLDSAGQRITGINETTRKAVAQQLSEGVRRGYSIPQIADGVAAEGFEGLRALPAFDYSRAELVARTETMLGYNESAIRGYAEFGVTELEAIDGDFDDECAARDGQVFTVDEALAIEDHPNGTLDWAPISDKAQHEPDRVSQVIDFATKALELASARPEPATVNITNQPPAVQVDAPITVTMPEQQAPAITVEGPVITLPEQAAPVVNITNIPPPVNVEPADVVVTMPDVHVEAPVINVTLPEPRATTKRVVREGGVITEIIEEPTDG